MEVGVGREEEKIACYVASGCSCQYGGSNTPCHRAFTAALFRERRDECWELTRDKLDVPFMGQLWAFALRGSHTQRLKQKVTERVQMSTKFSIAGHQMCISTFCFAHTIGISKVNII